MACNTKAVIPKPKQHSCTKGYGSPEGQDEKSDIKSGDQEMAVMVG